ncbi:hypothetical protein ONZ45_g6622 [Pleurotus djamor]|nr:hypothetical protein ONZ45_g6622 [Pleurotus djamor]
MELGVSLDGNRVDDTNVDGDENLGLTERMKPDTKEYMERRKKLLTAVYEKETDLKKWITEYPGLRKPSWKAAKNAMISELVLPPSFPYCYSEGGLPAD